MIVHQPDLAEFLKTAGPRVWVAVNEAQDTHFSRFYVLLSSQNGSGEMILHQAGVFQNFVSDEEGRRASREEAEKLLLQLREKLVRAGLEVKNGQGG